MSEDDKDLEEEMWDEVRLTIMQKFADNPDMDSAHQEHLAQLSYSLLCYARDLSKGCPGILVATLDVSRDTLFRLLGVSTREGNVDDER